MATPNAIDQGSNNRAQWRGGLGKDFSYTCPCDRTITVSTAEAGTKIRCDCGEEISVPKLSQLREISGKDRYESGVVSEIQRLIRNGGLPTNGLCAILKRPTEDTITARVFIPRLFKNREKTEVGLIMMAGWIAVLLLSAFKKPYFEEDDGAQIIEVPLRVTAVRQKSVRSMNQRKLHHLFRTEPIYSRLLDENPHSRISIIG